MPASVAIYSFYSEAGHAHRHAPRPPTRCLYSLPVIVLYLFVNWKFGFRFFGGIKG